MVGHTTCGHDDEFAEPQRRKSSATHKQMTADGSWRREKRQLTKPKSSKNVKYRTQYVDLFVRAPLLLGDPIQTRDSDYKVEWGCAKKAMLRAWQGSISGGGGVHCHHDGAAGGGSLSRGNKPILH